MDEQRMNGWINGLMNGKMNRHFPTSVDHGCQTDKGGCADICVPGITDNRVCLCRDNYDLKGETQCEDSKI